MSSKIQIAKSRLHSLIVYCEGQRIKLTTGAGGQDATHQYWEGQMAQVYKTILKELRLIACIAEEKDGL